MDLGPRRLKGARTWLAILPLILGALAMFYTLRSFDAASFRSQAQALNWRWVALAVTLDIASYCAQGYRWSLLLSPQCRVGPLAATRAIYAGLFVNEVVPMRPGEVLRGLLVSRESGATITAVTRTIVAERIMDGFCLFTAILLASLVVPLPHYLHTALPYLAAGMGLLGVLCMAVGRTRWREWSEGLKNRAAFAASLGVLLAQGLAMWAAIKACNLPLTLLAGAVVMLIVRIGTLLPGAPANLGTHQVSLVFGLSLFGVSQTEATSAAFLIFGILTIPLWLIGLSAAAATGVSWRGAPAESLRSASS